MIAIAPPPGLYDYASRMSTGFGVESRSVEAMSRESFRYASETFGQIFNNDVAGTAREQLINLGALPEDWDGEDAAPISSRTIGRAQELLDLMVQEVRYRRMEWIDPEVSPTPSGGVYFYWDLPSFKFSVTIAPHAQDLTVLLGTGEGRADRFTLSPAEIATVTTKIFQAMGTFCRDVAPHD